MATSVDRLQERTQDAGDLLCDILPSAITLASMLRHRRMVAWLRREFVGYDSRASAPAYRCDLPGHIEAKSPEFGWSPVPFDDAYLAESGCLDLLEGVRAIEPVYLSTKKGGGHHELLEQENKAALQQRITSLVESGFKSGELPDGWRPEFVGAELTIRRSRHVYSQLLRTIRSVVYLWVDGIIRAGVTGERNQYSPEERRMVQHLDTPEVFWQEAIVQLYELPVADVRQLRLLERLFGRGV